MQPGGIKKNPSTNKEHHNKQNPEKQRWEKAAPSY